jgi:hypothetical protein
MNAHFVYVNFLITNISYKYIASINFINNVSAIGLKSQNIVKNVRFVKDNLLILIFNYGYQKLKHQLNELYIKNLFNMND